MSTRILMVIGVLVVIAALAGCSQTATSQVGDAPTSVAGARDLGQAQRLVLGTLRLEGTDQAVDAQQAAELVVLWRAYRALSASDNAAAAELEAVIGQIEAGMTPAQLSAIAAMQLTQADLAAYVQDNGLQGAGRSASTQAAASGQTATAGGAATGGGQGGMMAGGGPGGELGGVPPAEMGGAAPATSASAQQGETASPVLTALYDAVIVLLSARA
jgi:phage FluMu protein gp41